MIHVQASAREFKRPRDNGEGLSRDQIVEKFKLLKADLDMSVIRAREILAWPFTAEQVAEQTVIKLNG